MSWLVCLTLLAPPAPEAFAAETAGGAVRGRVEALLPGWGVRFEGGAVVAAGELVGLRRAGAARPGWPAGAGVVLANGDRVPGAVVGGDRRVLRVRPAGQADGAPTWELPLSGVAVAWLVPPGEPFADAALDPARPAWREGAKRDALLTLKQDVLRGTVEAFASEPPGVRFKPAEGEPAVVPLAQLAAVGFDPGLARVRRAKEPAARFTLADGTRVTLASATLGDGQVRGPAVWSAAGAEVSFQWAQVVAVDVVGGPATPLSELKPAEAAVEPYNAIAWPWAADRTPRGGALKLRTALGLETFDRGLAAHSRTRLSYDLAGPFRRLRAEVGLDPADGARGQVDVTIELDGKPAPVAGRKGLSAAAAVAVDLDMQGAKRLTLIVDYGPGGDTQDHAVWGDARLIK